MEVMVAVQSGTLLHALRVQLKRRVSARRGGGYNELERELIQTQMAQKPMLRAEVGMRVRCANKASAE
jgi:hypothetical protein